jgi:hypothetical protein
LRRERRNSVARRQAQDERIRPPLILSPSKDARHRLRRLTPAIARAAGRDAGNKAMHEAGRLVWGPEDFDAAANEYDRLARAGGFWVDEFTNDLAAVARLEELRAHA